MLPASCVRRILTAGKSSCLTSHLRSLTLLPKTRVFSTLESVPKKTSFGSVLPTSNSQISAIIALPRVRRFSTQSESSTTAATDASSAASSAQQPQPQVVEAKPPKEYIQMLKEMADMQPTNAMSQAIYIKELNKIDPKAVIERLKDTKFAVNEEIVREHIKALIKEGAFDKIPLAQLVARLESATGGQLLGSGPSGTPEHPLHVILGQHWSTKFGTLLSILLTVALIYVIAFRGGGLGEFFQNKTPNQAEVATTTFNDVIGNEEAKEELGYIIDYLKSPGKYARLNVRLPKGILLVGPPGCGKTLLARAVAGESGVPFYYASGSEFEEMLVGVGARRIRNLFQKAKETSPCIIFIDEIDAIGGKRDAFDNKAKMTLNQLLVELDGFAPSSGVVVIAATNLQESLDPALIRPGRFDRQVSVTPPDVKARREMIGHYLNNRQAPDVDVEQLAKTTHGFSGADIFNMVNSAAIQATKNQMRKITMSQLRLALEDVVMGPARKSMLISPETKKITAFHESGHAIMALNAESEIFKATLVPRGMALGMVYFLPKDEHMTTKEDFLSNIDIAMGGRVAEELIFGPEKVTQGAGGDFQQATKTAQDMVLKYGMSPKVGHISIDTQQLRYMSPETKALIESEVKSILEDSYQRTKTFLTAHKTELTHLADALLEYETLTFDEVKAVVNKQDIHQIKKLKQQEEALLHEREKQHYQVPGVVPGDLSLPEKLDDSSVVTLKHDDKKEA